jgi:hypothetical protein
MGKGLVWNGSTVDTPVVFMPLTIAATWAAATNATTDADYEEIGPQVFRFEYYYLLTNGNLSVTPASGIQDVAAVVVDIAMIDPKSNVLLTDSQITALAGQLNDYSAGMVPGQLLANWQSTLDSNTSLPRPAISAIRLRERYFYLSPSTL